MVEVPSENKEPSETKTRVAWLLLTTIKKQ